jgi:superoxide reductase
MKRRALLKLAAAIPVLGAGVARSQSSVMIGGPMEGSLYFTRDNPGVFGSAAERHLPRIELEPAQGGTVGVRIATAHPMEPCRHYIQKHKLLDGRFRLISQKTFDPARDQPVSRHVLPAGYRGPIYAVSICNLHDAWIEGVVVGG